MAAPAQIIEWLARAAEQAVSDGMLLLIEPEPICWADTATVTAEMIESAGSHGLRINYDPGNVAWLQQRDPLDDFDRAARWIANVHVKDLLPLKPGQVRPEFVPAGEGMIDFRAHFEKLRQAGYGGPISLEPHMDGRLETIRRCRDAFERASSSAMHGEMFP